MPNGVLGGAGPAGEYCLENIIKYSFYPVHSKLYISMYKIKTPIPETSNTTTPTQRIPKASFIYYQLGLLLAALITYVYIWLQQCYLVVSTLADSGVTHSFISRSLVDKL